MGQYKSKLKDIKCLIFDVDGVLSVNNLVLDSDGSVVRTSNTKDGFALVEAVKHGLILGIISGGISNAVEIRYSNLGVQHIYMGINDKKECLDEIISKYGFAYNQVLYMGDDLPDYQVLSVVGLPSCPNDAVHEITEICEYISDKKAGEGCVRDVIEQVMRAQDLWPIDENLKNVKIKTNNNKQ